MFPGYDPFTDDDVIDRRQLATLDLHRNYSLYRVALETLFEAPFSGAGYFWGAWDDWVDLSLTPLTPSGDLDVNATAKLFDSWYMGCVATGVVALALYLATYIDEEHVLQPWRAVVSGCLVSLCRRAASCSLSQLRPLFSYIASSCECTQG
jgi:hypothetical protein